MQSARATRRVGTRRRPGSCTWSRGRGAGPHRHPRDPVPGPVRRTEAVDAAFAEIQQLAGACRFGDCAAPERTGLRGARGAATPASLRGLATTRGAGCSGRSRMRRCARPRRSCASTEGGSRGRPRRGRRSRDVPGPSAPVDMDPPARGVSACRAAGTSPAQGAPSRCGRRWCRCPARGHSAQARNRRGTGQRSRGSPS